MIFFVFFYPCNIIPFARVTASFCVVPFNNKLQYFTGDKSQAQKEPSNIPHSAAVPGMQWSW